MNVFMSIALNELRNKMPLVQIAITKYLFHCIFYFYRRMNREIQLSPSPMWTTSCMREYLVGNYSVIPGMFRNDGCHLSPYGKRIFGKYLALR